MLTFILNTISIIISIVFVSTIIFILFVMLCKSIKGLYNDFKINPKTTIIMLGIIILFALFYIGSCYYILNDKTFKKSFTIYFTIINIVYPLIFINNIKSIYKTIAFPSSYKKKYKKIYKLEQPKDLNNFDRNDIYDHIEKEQRDNISFIYMAGNVSYLFALIIVLCIIFLT